MSVSDPSAWVAYSQLEAWRRTVNKDGTIHADILVGNGDAAFPFLRITQPSLEAVPLKSLPTSTIVRCCADERSGTVSERSINIRKFMFCPPRPGQHVPYSTRVAKAFAVGLIQLIDKQSQWRHVRESPFSEIRSSPDCIIFSPEAWNDLESWDYRGHEKDLYAGLSDRRGYLQSRCVGMVYSGFKSYASILGTSLPPHSSQIPSGKVLGSELWALLLTMTGSYGEDPGPCVVLSFTDTHARVIIGDFKHGSTANNGRLYVQVVLNERLIISSDGSYDSKVYWRMLAWAFFRRMKKATRRSRKNGDEDGWISEDYDESGKWIDTET